MKREQNLMQNGRNSISVNVRMRWDQTWTGVETSCSDASGEGMQKNITIVTPFSYHISLAEESYHNVPPSVIREQNYRLEVILLF